MLLNHYIIDADQQPLDVVRWNNYPWKILRKNNIALIQNDNSCKLVLSGLQIYGV
jgi:hypothetical protein